MIYNFYLYLYIIIIKEFKNLEIMNKLQKKQGLYMCLEDSTVFEAGETYLFQLNRYGDLVYIEDTVEFLPIMQHFIKI